MRFHNTLLALIVFVGLAAFIYYYEYRGEEARENAQRAEGEVFDFEREKVTGLEIVKPGGATVQIVKQDGEWRIASPLQTRADPDKVDALLSSRDFLRIDRTIDDPEPLESYKLQDPQARVTLTLAASESDTQKTALLIGDKAQTGGGFYAARPDAKEVLKVSGGVDAILAADGASLRDKKIIGIDSWSLKRFRIERQGHAVALVKQDDDWRLESPISFPADRNEVQEIWSELGSAEAESIESEKPAPTDLSRFGLATGVLTLIAEGSEAAPVRVVFGRPEAAGAVFAQRSGMDAVMKVKAELFQKLEEAIGDVDALRDRRLAPVDRFRLGGIAVESPQSSFSLEKDEGSQWKWGGVEGPAAASEDVNALLDAIEELKASDFEDDPPVVEQAGPRLTLTLREDGGEQKRSVTIRVSSKPPDASGRWRLTSSASTSVYLVPQEVAQKLIDKAAGIKEPVPAAGEAK